MNILIEETDIKQKVMDIGRQINAEYRDRKPILIGVLKGAFVFLADLLREIDIPVEVDFLSIHSYDGSESSGVVRITHDLSLNIEDRDVILIEDIIDTGRTVNYILENLQTRKPRSLAVCALLSKETRRVMDVPLSYVGFTIPSVFVVGYGLDYGNHYRNLKYIGALDVK